MAIAQSSTITTQVAIESAPILHILSTNSLQFLFLFPSLAKLAQQNDLPHLLFSSC
jgi:hypothetical protein